LYHLEQDLKHLTGKTVFETFDFYAGTSGGALVLGSLVYANAKSVEEILNNYFNLATMKKIFKRSQASYLLSPLFRPKYDATEKYDTLYSAIGPKLITDTTKKVLVTSYSITAEVPRFFKSYDQKKETAKTMIVDAINASSAAPGYFPTAKFDYDSKVEYGTDGAVFANNPADCAYADALKLYGQSEDIRVLSIGTGSGEYPSFGSESMAWGVYQWATKGAIINKLVDVDSNVVNYRMEQFTKALGHKYVRIQGTVDIPLDSIQSMKELEDIAAKWYSENKDKIFETLFEEYTFLTAVC
jgi:predicted acylesterase/phospholipase RssA